MGVARLLLFFTVHFFILYIMKIGFEELFLMYTQHRYGPKEKPPEHLHHPSQTTEIFNKELVSKSGIAFVYFLTERSSIDRLMINFEWMDQHSRTSCSPTLTSMKSLNLIFLLPHRNFSQNRAYLESRIKSYQKSSMKSSNSTILSQCFMNQYMIKQVIPLSSHLNVMGPNINVDHGNDDIDDDDNDDDSVIDFPFYEAFLLLKNMGGIDYVMWMNEYSVPMDQNKHWVDGILSEIDDSFWMKGSLYHCSPIQEQMKNHHNHGEISKLSLFLFHLHPVALYNLNGHGFFDYLQRVHEMFVDLKSNMENRDPVPSPSTKGHERILTSRDILKQLISRCCNHTEITPNTLGEKCNDGRGILNLEDLTFMDMISLYRLVPFHFDSHSKHHFHKFKATKSIVHICDDLVYKVHQERQDSGYRYETHAGHDLSAAKLVTSHSWYFSNSDRRVYENLWESNRRYPTTLEKYLMRPIMKLKQ